MEEEQKPAKPVWLAWDEFLVSAWQAETEMYNAAMQFLSQYGITYGEVKGLGLEEVFAIVGITGRSPKVLSHLSCPVRAFFHQFLPRASDLLWEGRAAEAVRMMRKYQVGTEARLRPGRELDNLKRGAKRRTASRELPLIPGTNAMNIRHARPLKSDWGTVKPSKCRQRR